MEEPRLVFRRGGKTDGRARRGGGGGSRLALRNCAQLIFPSHRTEKKSGSGIGIERAGGSGLPTMIGERKDSRDAA